MENDAPPRLEELFDEDDPPPTVGYSDFHWLILNRWAEEMMRCARILGLI
jgi:hypothetical protein